MKSENIINNINNFNNINNNINNSNNNKNIKKEILSEEIKNHYFTSPMKFNEKQKKTFYSFFRKFDMKTKIKLPNFSLITNNKKEEDKNLKYVKKKILK